ncbi:hypothetical protein HUG17_0527 [Dermatophagoides farinae]|uniref:Uncharacterized protein n=1 Tax=Dermatophagoides farinae TaxID=6954 RepID=A0A9D4P786_DERFA|nr:hypothetical protein HUG17_0527 [Dermatophagoides farinae]
MSLSSKIAPIGRDYQHLTRLSWVQRNLHLSTRSGALSLEYDFHEKALFSAFVATEEISSINNIIIRC